MLKSIIVHLLNYNNMEELMVEYKVEITETYKAVLSVSLDEEDVEMARDIINKMYTDGKLNLYNNDIEIDTKISIKKNN